MLPCQSALIGVEGLSFSQDLHTLTLPNMGVKPLLLALPAHLASEEGENQATRLPAGWIGAPRWQSRTSFAGMRSCLVVVIWTRAGSSCYVKKPAKIFQKKITQKIPAHYF
jgi:hypothetical protein